MLLAIALIAPLVVVPACSPPNTSDITLSATTKTATYQTLARAGQSVYSKSCAVCHGADGEGTDMCPVVMWGSGSGLGTYNGVTLFTNAQGLLRFTTTMPITAPGSLTDQQYIDLMAYILINARKVSPSAIFDENQLKSISIP